MEKKKTSEESSKLSPAMERWREIKDQYPEYLIFYRMGDFYELFFEDAQIAVQALDIALTHRGKNEGKNIPMCGVPFHAYENYLARLIRQGYKVAICEQTETPEQAKQRGSGAILKREVVRLVTSGTITEDNLLNARKNNFLLCCTLKGYNLGFAWFDLSTADFYTQSLESSPHMLATDIASVISRLDPVEILISDAMLTQTQLFQLFNINKEKLTPLAQARFNYTNAKKFLEETFNVSSLDAYGSFTKLEIMAAGVIIDYAQTTQRSKIARLKTPIKFNNLKCMEIDSATRFNLELTQSVNGDRNQSLLHSIDRTITGAGARLLKQRLSAPSTDIEEINKRYDIINFFLEIPELRKELRDYLKDCADIERIIQRFSLQRIFPKDIADIGKTLLFIPKIRNLIFSHGRFKSLVAEVPQPLRDLLDQFGEFNELATRLCDALKDEDELPAHIKDGGFIREGFDPALDALIYHKNNAQTLIRDMEKKYIEETGVSALKVKYNNVLGYFVEVPSKFATTFIQNSKFVHRQSILTAARFTTVELSEAEQKNSSISERILAMEIEIVNTLIDDIICRAGKLRNSAKVIAELDVGAALAELAQSENYVRPTIDGSLTFEVKEGRHPMVEEALKRMNNGSFIGNDCYLDATANRVWLLTGPNMAGKSTFLRQNAAIAILAQMGSYVPCKYAHIGIIDKIFSRVGASDDLSRGRSTFMVEMVETAAILNQATERSFVILDEIGRGTATYDGLSIAWAVVEHLHEVNKCRALFATHYHELTALQSKLKELSLHCMKIKEFNDEIIFLHEVIDGTADRSYGIHVAKLAGLPKLVLKRADQILHSLEQSHHNQGAMTIENDLPLFSVFKKEVESEQTKEPSALMQMLEKLNPDDFSPREALEKLYEIKNLADQDQN